MKIILLGAPGAGKGTLANGLIKELKIPTISTGDLLRNEVKSGSELGNKVKDIMTSGKLVPTEVVIELLQKRLAQSDTQNGFILDGFPRSIEQAKLLEEIADIDKCLNLVIDKQVILDRICGRRTCKTCGNIYNTNNYDNELCECGGELFAREDDNPETVAKRFDTFVTNTAPLIDYYKNKGILVDVICQEKAEDTLKNALEILK